MENMQEIMQKIFLFCIKEKERSGGISRIGIMDNGINSESRYQPSSSGMEAGKIMIFFERIKHSGDGHYNKCLDDYEKQMRDLGHINVK